MGLSPRFLGILKQHGYSPRKLHRIDTLKVLLCAGSPLKPDLYDFIMTDIKKGLYM